MEIRLIGWELEDWTHLAQHTGPCEHGNVRSVSIKDRIS